MRGMKLQITMAVVAAGALAVFSDLRAQEAASPDGEETPASADDLRAERDRHWEEARQRRKDGEHAEAAEAGERMLTIERKWLGDANDKIAVSLEWLADVYEQAEDWPSAEARRREALAWRETHQGAARWETVNARLALVHVQRLQGLSEEERRTLAEADAKNERSVALYRQKRYEEALALAEEALASYRRLLGEEHPDTARSLNNLGFLREAVGDSAGAQRCHEQALALRRKVLGEEHPDTATSLNNLGMQLDAMNDDAAARSYYEQALAIRRKVLGEEHPDTATSLSYVGFLFTEKKDYAGARPYYERALAIRRRALGDEHRQTADSLNGLGFLLNRMGDYAGARPHFEEALAIRRKVLGEEHLDTAVSLSNLGYLLKAMGDYAGALPYMEQALAIERKALGEEHATTVRSLNSMGFLLKAKTDYAAARPYFEQALAIRRKVLGEDHPDTVTSLSNLGLLLRAMNDYAAARLCFEEVLSIRRRVLGEEHPDTAMSLNNVGVLARAMGDYAAARPYYEQALAIRQKVLGEEHPDTASSLNNLGLLLATMSDYEAARPYYEQALAIRRKVLGEEHRDTVTTLSNLGVLLQAMGDYAGARPCFDQAFAIRRKVLGEEHADTATSLNNLGTLLEDLGDFSRARPYYEQALAIRRKVLGEEHPDTVPSLNNLGNLLRAMGDYDGARDLLTRALSIRREALGNEHPKTANSLNTLGYLLETMKDYAGARPYYEEAVSIRRKVLGEAHSDTAVSLGNLGRMHYAMGDAAAARPYYEQALAINLQVLGEQHPQTAESLNEMGFLLQAMGDEAGALRYYERALTIVVKHLESTAVALTEAGQLDMSRSVQYALNSYVSIQLRMGGGAAEAYRAVLNWKGATLVRQRAARLVADNDELAPLLAELQAVVRQWSALAAAPPQNDPSGSDRLGALAKEKERLELALSRESGAFRAARASVDVAGLQAALPDGAALVDFYEIGVYEPSAEKPGGRAWRRALAAFVVRADGEVTMFDLGAVKPITGGIDVWRRGFGAGVDAENAGRWLREKLWAPLEEAIGDAELVLISPDGALGKLPFAALPGSKPDTYLIEDVALALVPVPQLIPVLMSEAGKPELPRELLVLGGVDYDRRTGAEVTAVASAAARRRPWDRGLAAAAEQQQITGGASWQYLSGTDSEASFIAALYQQLMQVPAGSPSIVYLRGAEATEEAFRQAASECYLLHVATHGFFAAEDKKSALAIDETQRDALRDNPFGDRLAAIRGHSPGLLSGLVLAGANAPIEIPDDPAQMAAIPDDGYLSADEIAFLPLGGARLAVLSACESGLGEVAGGEGLLGIQRAFQVAGARTTVATLWKVNDEATRRLMEEFYRNYLERELSPREALREAQLWALNNPDLVPRGADAPAAESESGAPARLPPQYWAAFTLAGDWR